MNEELNTEETIEVEKEQHPIFVVTKTSKYLALLLFIILPFVGGYIGYISAPEKVVEVEKIIDNTQNKIPTDSVKEIPNIAIYQLDPVTIGGVFLGKAKSAEVDYQTGRLIIDSENVFDIKIIPTYFDINSFATAWNSWFLYKNTVYTLGLSEPGARQIIEIGANKGVATLGYGYFSNGNDVYHYGNLLEGVSADNFTVLDIHPLYTTSYRDHDGNPLAFGIDGSKVYYRAVQLVGLDATDLTISTLESHGAAATYIHDQDTIYFSRVFCVPSQNGLQFELGDFSELEVTANSPFEQTCQWLKDRRDS